MPWTTSGWVEEDVQSPSHEGHSLLHAMPRRKQQKTRARQQALAASRPARNGRKRSQRRANKRAISRRSPAYDLACSVAKPFECSACIPDGSTGTGCFSTKNIASISTGTGGSCTGFYSQPALNGQYYIDTGSTAATPTITGNWTAAAQNATIDSFYNSYRPVSGGIRAYYTGPTSSDQGVVLVAQYPTNFNIAALNGKNLTQCVAVAMDYKLFSLRSGAEVTWRPESMADQMTWVNTSTAAVGVSVGALWPTVAVIAFNAGAAQGCLAVDNIWNYEGQYTSQTFMPGGIDESPKSVEMGWYEKSKELYAYIEPIMPYVATTAGAVANYFGGPTLGAAASSLFGTLSASGLPSQLPFSSPRLSIMEI